MRHPMTGLSRATLHRSQHPAPQQLVEQFLRLLKQQVPELLLGHPDYLICRNRLQAPEMQINNSLRRAADYSSDRQMARRIERRRPIDRA